MTYFTVRPALRQKALNVRDPSRPFFKASHHWPCAAFRRLLRNAIDPLTERSLSFLSSEVFEETPCRFVPLRLRFSLSGGSSLSLRSSPLDVGPEFRIIPERLQRGVIRVERPGRPHRRTAAFPDSLRSRFKDGVFFADGEASGLDRRSTPAAPDGPADQRLAFAAPFIRRTLGQDRRRPASLALCPPHPFPNDGGASDRHVVAFALADGPRDLAVAATRLRHRLDLAEEAPAAGEVNEVIGFRLYSDCVAADSVLPDASPFGFVLSLQPRPLLRSTPESRPDGIDVLQTLSGYTLGNRYIAGSYRPLIRAVPSLSFCWIVFANHR